MLPSSSAFAGALAVAAVLLTVLLLTTSPPPRLQRLLASCTKAARAVSRAAALADSPHRSSPKPLAAPIPPDDGLPPEDLLEHTASSFASAVQSRLDGRGDRLARALYRAYFAAGGDLAAAAACNELAAAAPTLSGRLLGLCSASRPLRLVGNGAPPAAGETEKYVLRCAGGEDVEMVAMPAPGGDGWSLCVSSQVGCRQGCTFCETGRMGLLRDLSAGEIVAQVAIAAFELRLRVSNVMFMGMGEPLDNVDGVIRAVRALTEPLSFAIPLSHITVSTSGEAQHVHTLLDALPSVRIAFSLHAANEELRSTLMPINRRVPLTVLHGAMARYLRETRRRVTVQYVMLSGVNLEPRHADELAAFLGGVADDASVSIERFHINLIPYNPGSRPAHRAPGPAEARAFKTALMRAGFFVVIRVTKGAEKMAACGQLGNVHLRRELSCRRKAEAELGSSAPPPALPCGREDLSW